MTCLLCHADTEGWLSLEWGTVQRCPGCGLSQGPPFYAESSSPFPEGYADHCASLAGYALNIIDAETPTVLADDEMTAAAFRFAGVSGTNIYRWLTAQNPTADVITFGHGALGHSQAAKSQDDVVHRHADYVRVSLAKGGIWIVEEPYLVNLLTERRFTDFTPTRRTYWLVAPFARLMERHDLDVLDVHWKPYAGGTIRFTVGRREDYPYARGTDPWEWWEKTAGFLDQAIYSQVGYEYHLRKCEAERLKAHGTEGGVGTQG